MKRPPKATLVTGSNKATGYWVPYVLPKGARFAGRPSRVAVSLVRNVPTNVTALGTTDPFGPSTATLEFPGVTLLDEPGEGDLWWLVGENDVEIHWLDAATSKSIYQWEGTMLSLDYAENETGTSLSVTCQGAMLQLDNSRQAQLPLPATALRVGDRQPVQGPSQPSAGRHVHRVAVVVDEGVRQEVLGQPTPVPASSGNEQRAEVDRARSHDTRGTSPLLWSTSTPCSGRCSPPVGSGR